MALILHGALNNDQYDMADIYYPDFNDMKENEDFIDTKSNKTNSDNNLDTSNLSDELETESEYEEE